MAETPHSDELTIHVGTKEIYDAVIGVAARLDILTQSVNGVADQLADHEQRIRHSERRIARIQYGLPVTLIMGIVGTIATVLLK